MPELKDLLQALLVLLNSNAVLFSSIVGLAFYNDAKSWSSSLLYGLIVYFVLKVSVIPFKDSVLDLTDKIKNKFHRKSNEQHEANLLINQAEPKDIEVIIKLIKSNNVPVKTTTYIQLPEVFEKVKDSNILLSSYFIVWKYDDGDEICFRKNKFKFFKKAYKKTKGHLNLIDKNGEYIKELIDR